MPQFRKKPVVIDALQWNGDWEANQAWLESLGCGFGDDDSDEAAMWENDNGDGSLIIPTLEWDHRCNLGDWIIRGVKGEFYPCKPDIFAATYEPV